MYFIHIRVRRVYFFSPPFLSNRHYTRTSTLSITATATCTDREAYASMLSHTRKEKAFMCIALSICVGYYQFSRFISSVILVRLVILSVQSFCQFSRSEERSPHMNTCSFDHTSMMLQYSTRTHIYFASCMDRNSALLFAHNSLRVFPSCGYFWTAVIPTLRLYLCAVRDEQLQHSYCSADNSILIINIYPIGFVLIHRDTPCPTEFSYFFRTSWMYAPKVSLFHALSHIRRIWYLIVCVWRVHKLYLYCITCFATHSVATTTCSIVLMS